MGKAPRIKSMYSIVHTKRSISPSSSSSYSAQFFTTGTCSAQTLGIAAVFMKTAYLPAALFLGDFFLDFGEGFCHFWVFGYGGGERDVYAEEEKRGMWAYRLAGGSGRDLTGDLFLVEFMSTEYKIIEIEHTITAFPGSKSYMRKY